VLEYNTLMNRLGHPVAGAGEGAEKGAGEGEERGKKKRKHEEGGALTRI